MKPNTQRIKHKNDSKDWSYDNFVRRLKRGLGADHDGGHKGSARDIREHKKLESRRRRRRMNKEGCDE